MKKKGLKKYLLPLITFFMLVTCLDIWLLGSLFIPAMYDVEYFAKYYKLSEWGITVFELKLLGILVLVIASGAWFLLGVRIERTFNVHLFPNLSVVLDNYHRARARPNLLKVIAQKKKLPKQMAKHQENK